MGEGLQGLQQKDVVKYRIMITFRAEFLHVGVSGCSVLKVLRGFDPGATPDMLIWPLQGIFAVIKPDKMKTGRITFTIFIQNSKCRRCRGTFRSLKGYKQTPTKLKAEGFGLLWNVAGHLALWLHFLVVTLVSDDATSDIIAHH